MDNKVAAIRSDQWRKTVYECINRDPKLSKRQWCQENGIKYRSYMYWQRKFQQEAIIQMETHKDVYPDRTAIVPAFVDMTAQLNALQSGKDSVPAETDPEPLAPELMIRAGSYRIYVNRSIQESTLETVMKVIGNA